MKYIKDNKKTLNIPDTYTSGSMKLATFPTVLPLVKGYRIQEGDLRNEEFRKEVASMHPTYECWIRLKTGYYCDGNFCTDDCPDPRDPDITP